MALGKWKIIRLMSPRVSVPLSPKSQCLWPNLMRHIVLFISGKNCERLGNGQTNRCLFNVLSSVPFWIFWFSRGLPFTGFELFCNSLYFGKLIEVMQIVFAYWSIAEFCSLAMPQMLQKRPIVYPFNKSTVFDCFYERGFYNCFLNWWWTK